MKIRVLIIIAVLFVCLPWVFHISNTSEVAVDGITTSAIVVWSVTIIMSLYSWFLLSWATRNIKETGIFLSIITGILLVIPFVEILGPMVGIVLGVVAGFVAFMLQKYITTPTEINYLLIAIITSAATYCVLTILILLVQPFPIWYVDYIGGGSLDRDPDLRPSYALDFMWGLFYHTIIPLVGLGVCISALFLVPYFILKRKNIPSKPYLSLILAGLLLYMVIPNFASSLQMFAMILSRPDQTITWVFNYRFALILMPFIVLIIPGILLYRSSVIRNLVRRKRNEN